MCEKQSDKKSALKAKDYSSGTHGDNNHNNISVTVRECLFMFLLRAFTHLMIFFKVQKEAISMTESSDSSQ